MDCSVQYTASGARPKQEIAERGHGMNTIPRGEMNQLDEMALRALNNLRYLVGNSVYTSFVSFSKTLMEDDSRGGRPLGREEDDAWRIPFQLGKLPWKLTDRNATSSCSIMRDDTPCVIASERHLDTKDPSGSVILYDLLERQQHCVKLVERYRNI